MISLFVVSCLITSHAASPFFALFAIAKRKNSGNPSPASPVGIKSALYLSVISVSSAYTYCIYVFVCPLTSKLIAMSLSSVSQFSAPLPVATAGLQQSTRRIRSLKYAFISGEVFMYSTNSSISMLLMSMSSLKYGLIAL